MTTKVKNTVPWTYVISDLNGEETVWGKRIAKTNKKKFRVENVIKRKHHKLHVKWKGHDNLFNSWIKERHSLNE